MVDTDVDGMVLIGCRDWTVIDCLLLGASVDMEVADWILSVEVNNKDTVHYYHEYLILIINLM